MTTTAHQTPAAPTAGSDRHPWVRRLFLLNLFLQWGIIVTGGTVRLTASGLGCPTWPQCTKGSFVPVAGQAEGFHRFIEFGNRTLTGVLALGALMCVVAIVRWVPERKRTLLPWAWAVLGGVVFQAVLGGVTVLTRLHPATVAAHFLVSALLVSASMVLVWREREGDGPAVPLVPTPVRRLAWGTAAAFAVVMVLGTVVTGAGPHSGDADELARFDISPRAMSWLHADAVMIFLGLAIGTLVAACLVTESRRPRIAWTWVLVASVLQGVVGYVQYLTRLPIVLVLTHMGAAALLAAAVTAGMLSLRRRD